MTETAKPAGFDPKAAILETQNELRHLGAGVLSSVNREEMAAIIDGAHKSGGCAAVVPALVEDISSWVKNPTEAMLVAFGLSFASKIHAQATQEAGAGPHHAPEPPTVETF